MIEIKYTEKTNFDALGRSGFVQCHGIAISNLHPEIFLEPINSRGDLSSCRIVVPLASVAALRDALTVILAEPATVAAIGPDPATNAPDSLLTLFREIDQAVAELKDLETKWEDDAAMVAAQTRLSGLIVKRDAILAGPVKPAAKPLPCADEECGEYRNMNGGCDVCGAPCL
jgi:hypothetical protein